MTKLCKCGCGKEIIIKPYHNWYGFPDYKQGHNARKKPYKDKSKILCACGCRQIVKATNKYFTPKYIKRHIIAWNRNIEMSQEFKEKCRKRQLGKKQTKNQIKKRLKTRRKNYPNWFKNIKKTKEKLFNITKQRHKEKKFGFEKGYIPHNKGKKSPIRNKTYEEIYGEERTIEIKNKIRKTVLKNYQKNPELIQKIKEKRKHQKPCYESSTEKLLHKKLNDNNIIFKKHYYIKNIKHSYQSDIFIEPNIVIECDGNYWHKYPEGLNIDHIRTKELQNKDYIVLRFWENKINNNINKCVEEIKNAIK